jgi:MFS-type transporter involved in bile tolerance (Atg22 family)
MTVAETRDKKREWRAWYLYDWANSPFYSSVITVFGALYLSEVAAADASSNFTLNGDRACTDPAGIENKLQNCDVSLFGLQFPGVLGGTNALSRSLFSQMIPAGKDAQYYSLYVVGERGTSWLGPLLFAAVGQLTGSFRYAIIALVIFFALGFLFVWLVPVRRAIEAAGNRPPAVL